MRTLGFSRSFGYWPCRASFFHFRFFTDFILDLFFRALAFSEADPSSVFSNSDIGTSPLNLIAFLVIEFLALDVSCSSTCFGYCPSLFFFYSDRALLLLS